MAKNVGFRVPMPVVTQDQRDRYPVTDGNDVRGGLHTVEKVSDMLSIPFLRRKLGMLCYVTSTGKTYRLVTHSNADITIITNWKEIKDPIDPSVLNNYATKTDLSNYAKKSDISDSSGNLIDFSNYATKTDLSNYAKKSDISDSTGKPIDFSNYATKTDLDKYAKKSDISDSSGQPIDFSKYAKKSDIPDTSNLATKSEVQSVDNKIPDLSGYAKKSDIKDPTNDINTLNNRIAQSEQNIANFNTYVTNKLKSVEMVQQEVHVEDIEVPKTVTFTIKNNNKDYKYSCVEILKHEKLDTPIQDNVLCNDFTAEEEDQFDHTSNVVFDGSMHIDTNTVIKMNNPTKFTDTLYLSVSDDIPYDVIKNASSITIE